MSDSGRWNPYVAGGLSGLVMVGSVALSNAYFGASTTFVRMAGMIEKAFAPEHVAGLAYFTKEAPIVDWQWMFVVGILLGAFVAAMLSGTYRVQAVPHMWRERFGTSAGLRGVAAFVGGFLALFGARLAGGCPSGHGLSGVAQLAGSGLVSLVCFFVGGLIVARLLYGGRR